MDRGELDRESYFWHIGIDFREVLPVTCQVVRSLILANGEIVPETPETPEIPRQMEFYARKRMEDATNLDATLKYHLEPVFTFLRRAKQQHFVFPYEKGTILRFIRVLRDSLDEVEEMVTENEDTDETDDGSSAVADDPDATRVEEEIIRKA
ncbi:hypothetical protein B0H17DRAFT_1149105 [Mycena rosella]|uniref:Uncharacterized protein n=1 Tax=Mycena rosella TaxID=1033263 RepID=A0AAD7FVG4_MYCRO|nr:hypothetical protein B0H17DRAFT_1149105 [Mycena rosella]